MDLTTTIDATTRVSAGYEEDGTLRVTVFAQAAYAKGRTATAAVETHEIPDALRTRLAAVLAEIQQAVAPPLRTRLTRALVKSVEVAAQMGELQ